jgi:hypothetical protein
MARFTYETNDETTIVNLQTEESLFKLTGESLLFPSLKANSTVSVYSLNGTQVFKKTIRQKGEYAFPLSNLSAGVYRLGYKSGTVGFYKYSSASAPAGIIYISALDAGANFLSFDFGDATGIESLTPDPSPKGEGSEYYNLAGQRVAQPTKGLYIVNGRKVVIK